MESYGYWTLRTDITEMGKEGFNERLNQLGAEGWRLVTAVTQQRHGHSHEVHLLFMRTLARDAPGLPIAT